MQQIWHRSVGRLLGQERTIPKARRADTPLRSHGSPLHRPRRLTITIDQIGTIPAIELPPQMVSIGERTWLFRQLPTIGRFVSKMGKHPMAKEDEYRRNAAQAVDLAHKAGSTGAEPT
jgi:hypothetical protein